jgi:hypothetical protein
MRAGYSRHSLLSEAQPMRALSFSYGISVMLACYVLNDVPIQGCVCESTLPVGAFDTVDVVVGSALVDTRSFVDHSTRIVGTRVTADSSTRMQTMTTRLTLGDSAGFPAGVLRIHAEFEALPGTGGPPGKRIEDLTVDRRTLAPYAIRREALGGPSQRMSVAFNGRSVRGSRAAGGQEQPFTLELSEPAFYGAGIDYVIERLPLRADVVYRIPVYQPGTPASERRLYRVVGKEALDVMGTHHPEAWRVEEHAADGRQLGTMWIVKGEPSYLVRWDFIMSPTTTFRLEQQLVTAAK